MDMRVQDSILWKTVIVNTFYLRRFSESRSSSGSTPSIHTHEWPFVGYFKYLHIKGANLLKIRFIP